MTHPLPTCMLAVTMLISTSVGADTPACAPIVGSFSALGNQQDGNLPPRTVVYLERAGPELPAGERHHFQFSLEPERGTADVVMFNRNGLKLFDFVTRQYTCDGQRLGYEGKITGGSEGCSREGHFRSTIHRDESGSLIFTYDEKVEYGTLCFKRPTHIVRTTVFPAYVKPP